MSREPIEHFLFRPVWVVAIRDAEPIGVELRGAVGQTLVLGLAATGLISDNSNQAYCRLSDLIAQL